MQRTELVTLVRDDNVEWKNSLQDAMILDRD